MAELTGERLRAVNFYFPVDKVAILKRIPGYESFDPQTEVLHCDKPGAGSVGAPRAFNVKLKRASGKNVGVQRSLLDDQVTFCCTALILGDYKVIHFNIEVIAFPNFYLLTFINVYL